MISAITINIVPKPTNTAYEMLIGIYFKAFIKEIKLTLTSAVVSKNSPKFDACFSPYAQPHSATAPSNIHKKPLFDKLFKTLLLSLKFFSPWLLSHHFLNYHLYFAQLSSLNFQKIQGQTLAR